MRRAVLVACCASLVVGSVIVSTSGCGAFTSEADGSDAAPEGASPLEGGPAGDGDSGTDGGRRRSLKPLFARGFGSSNDAGAAGAAISPAAMVVEPGGRISILGSYSVGRVSFGATALPLPTGWDAFVVQLDGTGAYLGSKAFTENDDQFGRALAVSSDGFYAGFSLAGTMTFATGDYATSNGITGKRNAVVARLAPTFGGAGHRGFTGKFDIAVEHVALGTSGSAIAFGEWEVEVSVNGASSVQRNPAGTGLVLMRAFGLSSDVVRTSLCGDSPNSCSAGAIASSSTSGRSLAGGRFTGTLAAPDAGTDLTGDNDAYLLKLDQDLVTQWVLSLSGTGTQEVHAIASIPGTDDFIAAGMFDGTFDLPGAAPVSAQGSDIFVVRVDTNGTIVWAKTFRGAGSDRVRAIAADAAGNVFLTGTFNGPTVDFGGGALANADTNGSSSDDVFVAWLDGSGKHVYSTRFGDKGQDDVADIGLDAAGNVVLTGSFTDAIDFGTGALVAHGKTDMFLAKLGR